MRATLMLLALCLPPAAQAAPPKKAAVDLVLSGDTVTYVKSFPCQVTAKAGADFYIWSTPDGVKATSADNVLTVTAAPNGPTRITVVAVTIDVAFDEATKKVTKKVTKDAGFVEINFGLPEPPKPPGPPGPGPTPPKPPQPTGALRLLIVYETAEAEKMPRYVFSVPFRSKLTSLCEKDESGRGWNMWDKDDDATAMPKRWQALLARPRPGVPYVHVTRGDAVAYEGPLPADEAGFLALLETPKRGAR